MNALTRRTLDALLVHVLRRPCPERIPSGARRADVDCFSVMINDSSGESYLQLRSTDGNVAKALQWDGSGFAIATTIPHALIDPAALDVTHFWGANTIRYEGLARLALGRLTRWPYLFLRIREAGDAVLQWAFNQRSLGSQARIDTLRDLLQFGMDNDGGATAIQIMNYRHGSRWVGHPDWRDHHRRLDTLLGLLHESGEISKDGILRYKATGRTVAILEEAESEDRRHRANLRLQMILASLALVTALFTAAQANFFKLPTVFDWSTKPATQVPPENRGPGGCLQLDVDPTKP